MFPPGTFRLSSLHRPPSAQSVFEAVPNQACQQEGAIKQSVTEKQQVQYRNYTSATTQAAQSVEARGKASTVQVPYLSYKPKKPRFHIRRTKVWKRVNKGTQVSEKQLQPTRKSIIEFSFEPLTAAEMSLTKVDEKKLDAQVKSVDMSEEMQQEAIEVAQEAMSKFSVEKDIAMHIKKTFDERKGPTWHCIVGRNFGSFVTHETKHFIYFYLGHCAILLFKTQ
ncbi:related to dynein light chain [Phialocephala subalpina]|uniref:Related to dynein light chain n=1 Tax=Phialocephala subalpina TaxID=576137 RepID=A0A1L7WQM2_9HELO|nr:related to dynein light chain [Phialocephala subalpina]